MPLTTTPSRARVAAIEVYAEIDHLNEQAASLERVSPSQMLKKAQQAHQLATTAGYAKGIARSLAQMGKAHVRLGNLVEADQFLAQAQASKVGDPQLQGEIFSNRGINYIYSRVYDKAFAAFHQGLDLARNSGNQVLEAQLLNNIGEIYREHKDFATAIAYYNQSLEAQRTLPDFKRKSVPVANLSTVYLEMNDLDNAELYARQALDVAREQNDQMIESACLQQLGIIAKRRGQQEQAIEYLEASLEIYRSTKETIHTTEVLLAFHELYFDAGNVELSLQYLERALHLAEEADSLALRVDIYTEMARVYEYIGDMQKALFYYKQYQATMVAIDKAEREQRLRAIDMQIAADESFREKEAYRLLNEELDRRAKDLEEEILTRQAISDIGRSITATLDLQHIFDLVYRRMQQVMPADCFGIGLYDATTNAIEYLYLMEDDNPVEGYSTSLENTSSFAVTCYQQRQGMLINSYDEIISVFADITPRREPSMAAIMFQPLMVKGESIGVVTVQSRTERVYGQKTLDVLGMLASYLSIAILNARRSEKLQEEIQQRQQVEQQLRQLNRELARLSNRDGLTNVANRRYFDQTLQHVWHRALRQQLYVSLLLIDVDFLKKYNDLHGHLSGDDVIRGIAQALEQSVKRSTDLVARYGGDEFVVLLNDTDTTAAVAVAETIQRNVAACCSTLPQLERSTPLTVSIGLATMMPDANSHSRDLIARSDLALYQAKQAGRNCIRVY